MNLHCFKKVGIALPVFCTFFFLFLFSCKEEKESTIDRTLEPYLDRFIAESIKRGRMLSIDKDGGLILEFADLTPPTIGLCYSTLPVRIQIDRTYWKETEASANRENLREELVFHELGHGFLGRGHKNDSLPNNEWTSMMCGEPQVNGRNWLVNYNGYRKKYYLDELFNARTSAPEWSKLANFDGEKGTLREKKNEEFQRSSSENRFFQLYRTDGSIFSDFYIETEMKVSYAQKNGAFSGIFAGNDRLGDYNYFTVEPNNRSFVVNYQCLLPFAEVSMGDKYKQEEYNKLAISKRGDELFFYINDQLVYRNDYEIPSYNIFGVIIPAQGSVSIRNYAVYTDENAILKAAQQNENPILKEVSLPARMNYLK